MVLLCAGHLSQERCWKFLERLVAQGGTPAERAAALALATDALAELERFKGQGPLNERIVAGALAILEAPPREAPAAARVICGRVLAQLGDPRPGVCTLPPAMVPIAGARFVIGSTRAEAEQAGTVWEAYWLNQDDKEAAKEAQKRPENEINDQPITLGAFALGQYPVTNAQFELFLAEGGYDPTRPWWDGAGRAWLARNARASERLRPSQRRRFKDRPNFWDDERFGSAWPNHPVVGVSWYEATAFCRWLTQHPTYNPAGYVYALPSEAEWEYAARGTERRSYPWGPEEPDGERANFNRIYNGTTPVGCFPDGVTPEGVLDLAGNVWEWTQSAYRPYPYDPSDGREDATTPARKRFTIRGSGWPSPPLYLRASCRDFLPPVAYRGLGFRLARHP